MTYAGFEKLDSISVKFYATHKQIFYMEVKQFKSQPFLQFDISVSGLRDFNALRNKEASKPEITIISVDLTKDILLNALICTILTTS